MIKFGKDCRFLVDLKKDFFENNGKTLQQLKKYLNFYRKQPKRSRCVNCGFLLPEKDFVRFKTEYAFCGVCGHLNGLHQDTEKFCNFLYSDDNGKKYAKTYAFKNRDEFELRAQEIYFPKAEFLLQSLGHEKISDLRFCEIGCGSGYMLFSLKEKGIKNLIGYDVSAHQVQEANTILDSNIARVCKASDLEKIISELNCEVLILIGTLEHLRNVRSVLKCIANNKNIKYVFFSVPMVSPSAFLEITFDDIAPRQFSDHIHLYTENSINYFLNEFGFIKISEWWFGSDAIDLYRSILIKLSKLNCSKNIIELWEKMFMSFINGVQLEIDKNKLSSEVHMLVKKC